jgi:hypothetical protein
MTGAEGEPARWWAVRRASSSKPATYRCPLCGRLLHAMSEHMLIAPEGDSSRRRHAHSGCVARARASGTLRTLDDWRAAQPRHGILATIGRSIPILRGRAPHSRGPA